MFLESFQTTKMILYVDKILALIIYPWHIPLFITEEVFVTVLTLLFYTVLNWTLFSWFSSHLVNMFIHLT